MNGVNLLARAEDMVADAVEKYSFGEEVDYAVIGGMAPLPGGVQPILAIALTVPSLVLGEFIIGHDVITTVRPDEDVIGAKVQEMISALKEARLKQATASNGHGQQLPPTSPGGIHLPG